MKTLITPTLNDVLKEFDTSSQLKRDELEKQNKLLMRQITINNMKISKLNNALGREQTVVANRLNKQIPNWRSILISSLKR